MLIMDKFNLALSKNIAANGRFVEGALFVLSILSARYFAALLIVVSVFAAMAADTLKLYGSRHAIIASGIAHGVALAVFIIIAIHVWGI
jgi:hypothetical protein